MVNNPLLLRPILLVSRNGIKTKHPQIASRMFSCDMNVKEIQIPTGWGHISAKWWGKEDKRPLLALHGWQDNAATWDTLVPLLPKDCSVLAIDLPGHGNSSWYPPGMVYYPWDWIRVIQLIKDHYKWDKVSLLAHSMGSIASMRYACVYPESVDFYIGIDNIIMDKIKPDYLVKHLPQRLEKAEIEQKRLDTEPPSYTYEQAIQLLHEGTGKSISMESAPYLIKRGTKPSKKDSNKFYFCRDSRLKYILFVPEDKEFVKTFARRMMTPTLFMKTKDPRFGGDEFSTEIRNLIMENNSNFEFHYIDGTHHTHLNNPEIVAPLVNDFLKRYHKPTPQKL